MIFLAEMGWENELKSCTIRSPYTNGPPYRHIRRGKNPDKIVWGIITLYKRPGETTDSLNVDLGVKHWLKKGLSAGKLNLGIPMYGRTWMLSSDSIKPNSPASGPGPVGPFTAEAGSLAYYEICNYVRTDGWRVVRDSHP